MPMENKKMKFALILMLTLSLSGCAIPNSNFNNYKLEKRFDSGAAKITYTLDSEVDYDEYLPIIYKRLDSLGYTEYEAKILSDTSFVLTVKGNNNTDYESLANYISAKGYITFRDLDNNILLNRNDIEYASAQHGQLSENRENEYYVLLKFTAEGAEKFSSATEKISKLEPGYNCIAIMLDDAVISQPSVTSKIDSDEVVISGIFTLDDVKELAGIINSGVMPTGAEVTNIEIIK